MESLDKYLQDHGTAIHARHVHLVKGESPSVIKEFVKTGDVDLVVMNAFARAAMAGMLMGNTARQILDRSECSVLAFKAANLVCPVRLDECMGRVQPQAVGETQ